MYAYNPNRKGIAEVQILKLETHRLYPPKDQLNTEFLRRPKSGGIKFDRTTPIASIGSCFAREIKYWLRDNGYNYIQTADGPCTEAGSARYDRVYNTFSIRQEFERAFAEFNPICDHWAFFEDGKQRFLDPHRHCVAWSDPEDMKVELAEHKNAVKDAFSQAEVIIITVGQSEIWYDKRDGTVFPMAPPTKVFDRDIHGFRMSNFTENYLNLERVHQLIQEHNPKAHLIITVSPVPLLATFQDRNSVEANCGSKSLLRAVVDEFVRQHPETTSYFPAYEVVTCTESDPFLEDARHVQRTTVGAIMSLFEHRFLAQDAATADDDLVHNGNDALAAKNWAEAAGHFEELVSRIQGHARPAMHPLAPCLDQIYQALGRAYMSMERYQDAYAILALALRTTEPKTPRFYHILNEVSALAIDLQDVDHVTEYMELILNDPNAPVDMFLHYVGVCETWYQHDVAKQLLQHAATAHPRIVIHPEFSALAEHFGLPKSGETNTVSIPNHEVQGALKLGG